MVPVSVVIMTKDESAILGKTLQSVGGLTDDIVIVDNGSTDGTVSIARSFGCRVIETEWLGYGLTKNKGIDTAKYDWILSLDADECPDATLLQAISHINFSETGVAYDLDFKTYFGNKRIKFGEWGVDHHIRLVNRQRIRWTDDKVHEQLRVPDDIQIIKLAGSVHHYTIGNASELKQKMTRYAELNAQQYHALKKSPGLKPWLSPAFNFIKNYVFKLGFLDGHEGFVIARMSAYYTRLKYKRLQALNKGSQKWHKN